MPAQPSSLIEFYPGWEIYQQSFVKTVAQLSSEQLALPIAAHHWSIGSLLRHMLGARILWFHYVMGEGSSDVARWSFDGQPLPESSELVAGFEATWQMIATALTSWTPANLGDLFPTPAFMKENEEDDLPPCTRGWIIWHVLEHEIHHGGEFSLAQGVYGLDSHYIH